LRDARRLTSLVGQVELDLSAEEFVNVDVIFKVIGLDAKKVLQRAMHIEFGQHGFLVMHPLDLLCSRTANLHELPDKKNEKGALQLGLAISVAREFLRETAAGIALLTPPPAAAPSNRWSRKSSAWPSAMPAARSPRAGSSMADAIDPSLIPAGPFWSRKWPTLRALMSAGHAARFTPPR